MKIDKEKATNDYLAMIKNGWTWERLTEDERERFISSVCSTKLSGAYYQRCYFIAALYGSFLSALDYKPMGWRESGKEYIIFSE